ncbi:MAG: hypothetical protein ACFE9S_11780 [Candidatus Hermodarchaeota archaeon]
MDSEELYKKLKSYFPHNIDLMRYLKVNACWEYFITENSLNEERPKLQYYLYKKNETTLEMVEINPGIKPDLILYFTENAILNLINGNPNADEYYTRYRKVMYNSDSEIQVDNKINKPRFKLLKLGYQKWQKDFKF